MIQRVVKATVSGWRPWAIGAAFSMGCAAFLLFRRSRSRPAGDDYEAWWHHREHVRANGDQPRPAGSHRAHNLQLFV
ncbi:MAG TPA: hypothetical protein VFV05_12735 [Methylomirabilota bacterium]|nr:hypothetical protein [Methylomirabilota bacterium]